MKYQHLISESKRNLTLTPLNLKEVFSVNIFQLGAMWMFKKLNEKELGEVMEFNKAVNYFAHGFLKYGISLSVFFISAFLLFRVSVFFTPLSIVFFYLAEIHFLFLFPILIDNIENPIWTSIKQTYKLGLITTLITVIPISFYMLIGLLNFKDPFRNWHIGCLSIIIWYQDEIRNRV